ncbi:MAG: Phosphonopyruvate hydrolase [Sodalis sp.]|nr:MAG: Phosphonopyruvate hydrolase [Sodalis sp.]
MCAIASVVKAPVIVDIDIGFGNTVNVSYVIPQNEMASISVVVMQDQTFSKTRACAPGGWQKLVNLETFQGKISAAIDVRQENNLVIIARIEALIAGLGQENALRLAYAYQEAGVDAILGQTVY